MGSPNQPTSLGGLGHALQKGKSQNLEVKSLSFKLINFELKF
jgi:hypothetical protein